MGRRLVSAASPSSSRSSGSTVPPPPDPFDALEHVLKAGTVLHRVHGSFPAGSFNPGVGNPTRFAHFTNAADPSGGAVAVLYAAATAEAAVCETLLHDVPLEGGRLSAAKYRGRSETTLVLKRQVRLAKLMGPGLRRLHVAPQDLTATDGDVYSQTVLWAQAAHTAGFDGLAWMSARENTAEAYVLFGDRVFEADLDETTDGLGSFDRPGAGFRWLSAYCALVKVELLLS